MLSTTDKAFSEKACSGSSKGGGGAFLALKKKIKKLNKILKNLINNDKTSFISAVHVIFKVF